jgi:hypothetical protein
MQLSRAGADTAGLGAIGLGLGSGMGLLPKPTQLSLARGVA